MKIEYMNVGKLKPYDKNAKKHPAEQVKKIAQSIKEFGWQQPLVIDKNNEIVIGHGRWLAAKELKIESVPVVKAENLTDDQIRALRLADNRVAESEWDYELLEDSLEEIADIDMTVFGFDDIIIADDHIPVRSAPREQSISNNVFENQERAQMVGSNYYGIPEIRATQTYGTKMWRFCDWNELDDPENYIAHFYYDDFKFISAWRDPDKYVERLKRFKAVIAPDFSLYTDFPRALQILSCYRRNWCGAYWQSLGLDIIPDVVWGDEESFNYCFEGLPMHSTVAVSTVGVKKDKDWNGKAGEMFMAGYNEMVKRLAPTTILFYGDMIEGCTGNIIRCPSFYEERRNKVFKRTSI